MSDLIDDTEHLKRAVAVPGTFATVFPDTLDADLIGALEDGFAEAQLFGFLLDYTIVGSVVSPDLVVPERALVVLFSAASILSNQLANASSRQRYVAGPVEFEQETGASILKERLAYVQKQRDYLITKGEESDVYRDGMWMGDQAFVRAVSDYGYGGLTVDFGYADAFGY